jgi:hypothetical protein
MRQLSCYTTSLLGYLLRYQLDVADRMATATRLAVRIDLPDGQVAFSHHERVDQYDGGQLSYTGSTRRDDVAASIHEELTAAGAMLVVANTYELPWSPLYGQSVTPHWLLLTASRADEYHVVDPFEALLPHGEQRAFAGWVDAAELVRWMELPVGLATHIARRDRLALGAAVTVPSTARWRWLHRVPWAGDCGDHRPDAGDWLLDTASSLRWLADRLASDEAALEACVDDLWAASRHHTFRAAWLRDSCLAPVVEANAAGALWTDLPRALRFAADSARHGRPRAALVRTTIRRLADAIDLLDHSTSLGRTHV